ncbi:MAG: hypothetical protein L0K86_02325 [Actinomycetia bacterium]|nr:hypothetical protein [Actinomycetes bacterium]
MRARLAGTRTARWCYRIAAVLIGVGVVHLGVQAVVGGPWDGPVSWRKPVTFGLAFGLTLATLGWVSGIMAGQWRARLLGVFAAACVVEVTVITTQAWRGVPSHFNTSTPLDATFAYIAAAGGAVILATSIGLAATTMRAHPDVPPSMRLAVRAGFATYLTTLVIGAVMIAIGVTAGRTVSQAAAYTAATELKAGHFATMHGILVLPVLAWLAAHATWTEQQRTSVVGIGCACYVLAAGAVVVESVLGIEPLAAPALVPTGLGLLGLLTAGASTLTAVADRRASSGGCKRRSGAYPGDSADQQAGNPAREGNVPCPQTQITAAPRAAHHEK